ncbi:MAG: glycosyltransferase family 2 protein [Thaumarchaeota archaeon]|nr:glycosyltransferase family 2 protein [Nitrososphaerota archaeon]
MDKNFLITILAEAIEQSKGDWGRNQYLLKRIEENKEIINSDKLYLERISGLKITEKTDYQHQQIPKKDKSVSLISDLVKCTTCNKEIKMNEKSTRHRNFWYHETCYEIIPEKKPKKEKRKIQEAQESIILENVDSKTILEKEKSTNKKTILESHRQSLKIKHDPVLILLAVVLFVFLFSAAYLLIGEFSLVAMILGGGLVLYQLLDAKKWGTKKFRTGRKIPAVFPMFLLFLPFALSGILAYEGYTAWESGYRAIIVWGLTLVFWSTLLMIPLAVYSKNKEDNLPTTPHTPLVTIVIPAYNEEKVIANTIESTLEINYPNKDIIVVDDGSKDNTLQIAKRYQDKGVKVLHKTNGGKASALNLALTFAKGELIAVLDADTLPGRNSLKEIVRVFENEKDIAAVAGNIKVRNKKNWITWCQALEYVAGIQIARRAFDLFGAITIVPGALGCFRKSVLVDTGGYDKETIVEDFDTTVKILKSGMIVRGTTKSVAYTEAPNTIRDFYNQRIRWYRGNLQVVAKHRDALKNPRFGYLQKLAFPYMLIAMIVLPITGFVVLASAILALIEGDTLFVITSFGFFIVLQYLINAMAVRLDGDDPKLILYSVFFNFGYKQLLDFILLWAAISQLFKRKAKWTSAKRIGFNEK